LEVSIKNMIKMYILSNQSTYEWIDSTTAIGTLCVFILFALLVPVFLTCKRNELSKPEFAAKYGSLTEQLNTKKVSIRFYYSLFAARRIILSAMIVFLTQWPFAQVQLICLFCTFQLIYIGYFQPYTFNWMNWLETFNEYIILASTYFLFLYTDGMLLVKLPTSAEQVKDQEMLTNVGYGHASLLGIIVAVNMVVMLVVQVSAIIRKIKLFCLKRAHKKAMAEYIKRKQLAEALHREFKDLVDDGQDNNSQSRDLQAKLLRMPNLSQNRRRQLAQIQDQS